jgi:TM2 domain-containing membrane protein YozV
MVEDNTENEKDHGSDENNASERLGHDEAFCTSCGEKIKKEAEICPHCGVRQLAERAETQSQASNQSNKQKDSGIAAIASFLVTGLGQIYNGQILKGIVLIILQGINLLLMFVLIGFFTYFITWIYGVYDAYHTAEKINQGEISV